MNRESLRLTDFDYHLPKELIAQYPCAKREDSRLLIVERAKDNIAHRSFGDIVDYFSGGDCLVLNNTKVIPARMIGRREKITPNIGGGKQEIFLLERLAPDTYRVLAKPAKQLAAGMRVLFNHGNIFAESLADEGVVKVVRFGGKKATGKFWQRYGLVPLPPYIKRRPDENDRKRYQTVYAQCAGATAAPTAGLHFSKRLLEKIEAKGVHLVYLTLHTSYGTFAPVKTEDLSAHKMYKEYFILPSYSARAINKAKENGKKVFAVGTTSARVLESCVVCQGKRAKLKANKGWTDLFIYPPYKFRIVDNLITNFHLPKSTLLMLVSAFAGRGLIFKAYQEAVARNYRFFSYGDAMLII